MIEFEDLANSIIAREDGQEIGHIRWRVEAGAWIYDSLFVVETHRNQGVSKELMSQAKVRRVSEDAPWRNVPTTHAGSIAVDGHIARNYDVDPRIGANNG